MADTTVVTTDGGEGTESSAETTAVQAVAETAKSSGEAQQSAEQAQEAADGTEANATVAAQGAIVASEAAMAASSAAANAQASENATLDAVRALAEQVGRLHESLTPATVVDTTPETSTLEVEESEPKKVPFLQRKWGKK